MRISRSLLPGCHLLELPAAVDERGTFSKTFSLPAFQALGLEHTIAECFHSFSRQGVLRGLHFQIPPHDHAKVVFCTWGRVLDAVVDLRAGSPTFGQHRTIILDGQRHEALYLPRGLAHGFLVLSDGAAMGYHTSTAHAPASDQGIHWDSVGIAWGASAPIISPRDAALPPLSAFDTPFRYCESRE